MYKKVFNLEQITPMWHFQGDDPNCCLRVTEVKPKLDRFIIKTKTLRGEAIPDDWWIDKGHNSALNYKMRISCNSVKILPDVQYKKDDNDNLIYKKGRPQKENIYPVFFANMGAADAKHKKLVMFSDIEVTIVSMVSELVDRIANIIDDFFANNSFGTRQDKGFGCFCVIDKESNRPIFQIPRNASYYFDVPVTYAGIDTEFSKLFKYIHYFHKVIRSGVNEPGCYIKSLMYYYARSMNDVWDKPVIRTNFQYHNKIYKYICGDICGENIQIKDLKNSRIRKRKSMKDEYCKHGTLIKHKRLYRDALGLAVSQDWRFYGNNKIIISLQNTTKTEIRFKSPIDYHPVPNEKGGFTVYITLNEIPVVLKEKRFRISLEKQQNNINNLKKMRIAETFSLRGYFEYINNNHRRQVQIRNKSSIAGGYVSHILGPEGNFSKMR